MMHVLGQDGSGIGTCGGVAAAGILIGNGSCCGCCCDCGRRITNDEDDVNGGAKGPALACRTLLVTLTDEECTELVVSPSLALPLPLVAALEVAWLTVWGSSGVLDICPRQSDTLVDSTLRFVVVGNTADYHALLRAQGFVHSDALHCQSFTHTQC
jgi:hypothetical protein